MDVQALLAARLAAPKKFRVTTTYLDGTEKTHDTETIGQARNWAAGEERKLGRELIDRMTGKKVTVVHVWVSAL